MLRIKNGANMSWQFDNKVNTRIASSWMTSKPSAPPFHTQQQPKAMQYVPNVFQKSGDVKKLNQKGIKL